GQVTYASIDQLYQVMYPAAWQNNPLISTEGIPNARDFSAPDGSAHFTVLPLQGTPTAQVAAFVASYLHDAGASSSTFGAGGGSAKVGANTWATQPFTIAMQGTGYTGTVYITTHSTFTVVILS